MKNRLTVSLIVTTGLLVGAATASAEMRVRFADPLVRGQAASPSVRHTPPRYTNQRAQRTQKRVRFNTAPRRAGAGYNNKKYDQRIAQPRSISKTSAGYQRAQAQRRFTRNLGASKRAEMTHRGNVARHARHKHKIKSTLRHAGKARNAKRLSTARKVGRFAAGGVVVGAASYGASQALGVRVPDAFDAASWTYGTLKDPKNAGRRIEKLGRDSSRTLQQAGHTLTNPHKMSRNLERSGKRAVKTVSKAGCSVGKLFGAKC